MACLKECVHQIENTCPGPGYYSKLVMWRVTKKQNTNTNTSNLMTLSLDTNQWLIYFLIVILFIIRKKLDSTLNFNNFYLNTPALKLGLFLYIAMIQCFQDIRMVKTQDTIVGQLLDCTLRAMHELWHRLQVWHLNAGLTDHMTLEHMWKVQCPSGPEGIWFGDLGPIRFLRFFWLGVVAGIL